MVAGRPRSQPFFSIGITTYNRHDLLREALNSVLDQDFGDFEIIVGNDYQAEVLNSEMLGICDPRLRIINHPVNLREVGNMNALLEVAEGRYFTWLFDDDLLEPDFLLQAHEFLSQESYPPVLFPMYRILWGLESFHPHRVTGYKKELITGKEFLNRYFSGNLKVLSTAGLFRTDSLKAMSPPMEELCQSAIGLYCEYLLLAKCATLETIGYMNAPFVVMRAHSGSWSESNLELDKYQEAGQALIERSAAVFRLTTASDGDFRRHLMGVCSLHLYTFAYKSARLEIAKGHYGIRAAFRAVARLYRESARTRRSFAQQTDMAETGVAFSFFPKQMKHIVLVIGTLMVHLARRTFPNILKRMQPTTGV